MRKVQSYQIAKRNIKIFSFIAIFALVAYLLALQVFAYEGSFVLGPDDTTYQKGGEVAVEIKVQTDQNWDGAGITLKYSTDVFDAQEVAFEKELRKADGSSLPRSTANKFTVQDVGAAGKISIAAAYIDSADPNATYSGTLTLGTLYLPIRNDAPGGNTKIEVIVEENGEPRTFLKQGDTDYTLDAQDIEVTIEVPLESHGVDKTSISLDITDKPTDTITISYLPLDTSVEKGFSFVSGNTSYATVSQNGAVGTVSAVAPGDTYITVTEFGATHTIPVSVTAVLKSITLSKNSLQMDIGDQESLTVNYSPVNTTTAKGVRWESTNTSAVTVANGVVTAVGQGTATVRAISTANSNIVGTCSVSVAGPVARPLTGVSLEEDNFELLKGESVDLQVNYVPGDTTDDRTVTWSSNNPNAAIVSNSGKITAVGGGDATITGTIQGFTLTATVHVDVPMTSFTATQTNVELTPGKTHTVQYSFLPSDTTDNKTITWNSNAPGVATVNNGVITAVNPGNATVTGTLQNGKKITISVKVLIPIQNISINPNGTTLYKGDSTRDHATLSAVITPSTAEESKVVSWTSSKPGVATVNSSGVVTAVSKGSTTITATLGNGMSASCTVNVEIAITSFTLTTNSSLTMSKGSTSEIRYTIGPSNATEDRTITWHSTNPSAATVTNGIIAAVNTGTTTITGTLPNGKKITVGVTVTNEARGIVINGPANVTVHRGQSTTLTTTVDPEDADGTVQWASSKNSIATVDSNGKVTGVGIGDAIITAKIGTKSATVVVSVDAPITNFTASPTSVQVVKGKKVTVSTTITPGDATDNKTITWSSENDSIATVSNGTITGVARGNTVVHGTLANGMHVDIPVEVTIIPVQSISINKESLTIKKGSTEKMSIVVNPTDATEVTDVTWTIEEPQYASVDSDGKVTGVAAGTTRLTASMGGKTASISVTVLEIPLTEIDVRSEKPKVEVDKVIQLNVVENPDNPLGTTDQISYSYESSDETIATVDAQGRVKGLRAGKVTITVTSSNGLVDDIELEIVEASATNSPNTGVPSVFIYILSALISLSGLGFIGFKKRHN